MRAKKIRQDGGLNLSVLPIIPSPSLVGQSVILNQAVLLAPVHRFSAPSQFSQWHIAEALAVTVAGPRRL